MEEQNVLDKVIDYVRSRGYAKIKSIHDDFEDPTAFVSKEREEEVIPTTTAYKHGRKSFFELAVKQEDPRRLLSKWKLLSVMARVKGGQLFLMVPRGNRAFVDRMLNKNNVNAHLVSI